MVEPPVFIPVVTWAAEDKDGGVTARIRVAPGDILRRLSTSQGRIYGQSMADVTAIGLVFIALLFLVIEGAALAMGALARSITGTCTRCSRGPSGVRLGDLGHRIPIRSRISSASWPSRSTR